MSENKPSSANPLNLDAPNFDCDTYLTQTLKTKKLDDLLEIELAMFRDVRSLECEMEQLVSRRFI
jgi:AmiR/NasT family two-component response regulator